MTTTTSPSEKNQAIIQSRQVLELITVANDFVSFIEKSEDYTKEQILNYLHRVFPLLYIKASLIPDIEVSDEEAIEHYVTEEQWESVFNLIHKALEKEDIYYYIDLHEHTHQDAIRASIAENVADLFQDLKDFLVLYQKPVYTFKENAIREVKQLFITRFGFILVNGLTAIHYLLYGHD